MEVLPMGRSRMMRHKESELKKKYIYNIFKIDNVITIVN